MFKIESSLKPVPLRCFDPVGGQYTVAFEVIYDEEKGLWKYYEKDFPYLPGIDEIKKETEDLINSEVAEEIMSGYTWNGMKVWLSLENQRNYESLLTSMQAELNVLPVKLRFGTATEPKYHVFEDLEEYKEFYTGLQKHITDCLSRGWARKDNVNYKIYESTKNSETT